VLDVRGRTWRVVRDGSLTGDINGEIVSPVLEYADIEELQQVVRAARAAGARADHSTGVHYARAVVMHCGAARLTSSWRPC
jgi:phage terminase large subunit-like protein